MYVALWLRLWGAVGTGDFNIAFRIAERVFDVRVQALSRRLPAERRFRTREEPRKLDVVSEGVARERNGGSARQWHGRRYADSVAAGGVCSWRRRRMRAALVGRYQFQSPSSFISEGTSSVRITVASKMIPAARPIANTLIS